MNRDRKAIQPDGRSLVEPDRISCTPGGQGCGTRGTREEHRRRWEGGRAVAPWEVSCTRHGHADGHARRIRATCALVRRVEGCLEAEERCRRIVETRVDVRGPAKGKRSRCGSAAPTSSPPSDACGTTPRELARLSNRTRRMACPRRPPEPCRRSMACCLGTTWTSEPRRQHLSPRRPTPTANDGNSAALPRFYEPSPFFKTTIAYVSCFAIHVFV